MPQLRGSFGFALKAMDVFFIDQSAKPWNLQRNDAVELGIVSFEYDAKRSGTDLFNNLKAAKRFLIDPSVAT